MARAFRRYVGGHAPRATVSKPKDRFLARQKLDEIGWDPLVHLAMIARNPSTPLSLQIEAARHCLAYCHPRLTDLDISVVQEGVVQSNPLVQIALGNILANGPSRRALEDAVIIACAQEAEQHRIEHARLPAVESVDG